MDDMDQNIKDLKVSNSLSEIKEDTNEGIVTTDVHKSNSFTGVMEELRQTSEEPKIFPRHYSWPNKSITEPRTPLILRNGNNTVFATKEKPLMDERLIPTEVLFYQGEQHSLDDIAFVWKKDCRKWLWKSNPGN